MKCAFDIPGQLVPTSSVEYISEAPSGAVLHYADGRTVDTPTPFASLLDGFIPINADGKKAVNYAYLNRAVANSAGTVTVVMTGGLRFECSDTYAELLELAKVCRAKSGQATFSPMSESGTLEAFQDIIEVTAPMVVTLPNSPPGKTFTVKNNSGGSITIASPQGIDGDLEITAANLESYSLVSNGATWLIL